MISTEQLFRRLSKVRGHGFRYTACCPSHDDHNPSLSITLDSDKVLLYCHAGCSFNSICDALDLEPSELQQERLHTYRDQQADRREYTPLQQAVSNKAQAIWAKSLPANPSHAYLVKKHIREHHLRQIGDDLVVPLTDANGKLWSLQFIAEDGKKRMLSGGLAKGCFTLFGASDPGPLQICEGIATAASLYQRTGVSTVAAMSAGNLLPVAKALNSIHYALTIAADNDHQSSRNVGLNKGRETSQHILARLIYPEACGPECLCTDFNDFFNCQNAGANSWKI